MMEFTVPGQDAVVSFQEDAEIQLCPYCGMPNEKEAAYCTACARSLQTAREQRNLIAKASEVLACPHCGRYHLQDAAICPNSNCGYVFQRAQQSTPPEPSEETVYVMHLNQDGTFSGVYQDWNMGAVTPEMEQEAGQALPNGQCYRCDFSGRFSNIRKVSEVEYVMEMTELTYLQEPGSHAVIDGAWFDYSEAYGLSGAKEVRLYLPGRATADISDEISGWLVIPHGLGELPEALEGWCLYNVADGLAFYGE